MVKQVGLLPAGCQPWNLGVCAASDDLFAYCATLAIYIYKMDQRFKEFRLISIMSEHKRNITSISWHPTNSDILASSGADCKIFVWKISQQRSIATFTDANKDPPICIGWSFHSETCLAFVSEKGPLQMWHYTESHCPGIVKDSQNFSSSVTLFRWHPKQTGMIAFGHVEGSISIVVIGSTAKGARHIMTPEDEDNDDAKDSVTALEWDPLSTDYLLVANKLFGIRLLDINAKTVITIFQTPTTAAQIQTLSWVHNAPGMFITGDAKSGVLRIWSVSKETPIENIRIKKSGFHELHVISSTGENSDFGKMSLNNYNHHISSTSEAHSPSLTAHKYFALPQAQLVCAFKDGGIGLYDLGHRRWKFLRDQGHLETIFDCKFHPDNPNHLATASFDGTIKIWDIATMEAVATSSGNEGIIYHISWAPSDLNCIAGCTAKNGIFIWDVKKSKVIKRIHDHGNVSVFSLSWNQKDPKLIMSCGGDGYCMIHMVDGTLMYKYKHPGAVYGGDWSPYNKDMLATGCEDKLVRVFYLGTTSSQPIKIFSGHTAKVFHIRWSPLREGILCSGSDDSTVRVWEYSQEECICRLSGHTAAVRGLTWNSEIPYLLVSGSWDSSIRIWDIRDGACISIVLDHGADVYGLACHPKRPFLMASSSRDSTVRLWLLTPLLTSVELNILARKPLTEIFGTPEKSMSLGTSALLTGKQSKDLKEELEKTSGSNPPMGMENLWDLVSLAKGVDVIMLSPGYRTGIVHSTHLTKFKASEAQELEMVKMSKFGGGIGLPTREDRLREAAKIHIRLGNLQRYCELMVELGEWLKALAVAPGVSVKYWKSLAERYTEFLLQKGSEEMIPFCVSTGNAQQLVSYFHDNGQHLDALITSQASCEDAFNHPHLEKRSKSNRFIASEAGVKANRRMLEESARQLSEWHFSNGSPVLAACCHLSVDDFKGAMSKLIRGNELELAVSVGTVLDNVPGELKMAIHLLSRRCEHLGYWELGVDLLKTLPDVSDLLIHICARCAASMDEINDLHKRAGLPSMEECLSKAKHLQQNSGSVKECVGLYLLSTEPEVGLEMGLKYVIGEILSSRHFSQDHSLSPFISDLFSRHPDRLSSRNWSSDDVFEMLQLLGCIRTDKLQQLKNAAVMYKLLALSAYIGALVAIRRGYDSIVSALFKHTRDMMTKDILSLPFTLHDVECNLQAWLQRGSTTGAEGEPNSLNWAQLQKQLGQETWPVEQGPDCVASSHLPSHSDVHTSVLTGQRIQGLAVFLEDGRSALSINEALMWAKVNPFSPLGSGMRINPF